MAQELFDRVTDSLRNLRKEISSVPELKKSEKDIDEVIENINSPLLVMVMGEFSRGKSTFINALVGQTITKVGAKPTTAVITKLSYGIEDKITVFMRDGSIKNCDTDDFLALTSESDEDTEKLHEEIDYVERKLPMDILKSMSIIDSPGLNSIKAVHEEITKKFMDKSDTVIWLFDAKDPGKQTEFDAMKRLNPRLSPLVLVNKIDDINEDEEDSTEKILSKIERDLSNNKLEYQKIIGISAKMAFQGKIKNDEKLIVESNIGEFYEAVDTMILPNSEKYKCNSMLDGLAQVVFSVGNVLNDKREENSKRRNDDYATYIETEERLSASFDELENVADIVMSEIESTQSTRRKRLNPAEKTFYGVLHWLGLFVEKSDDVSQQYLEEAAVRNDTVAQTILIDVYTDLQETERMLYWQKKVYKDCQMSSADAGKWLPISIEDTGVPEVERALQTLRDKAQSDKTPQEMYDIGKAKGMRDSLEKYIDIRSSFQVSFRIQGPSVYDFTCFGLDSGDKLSDDRYMIFYNQCSSPEGAIRYEEVPQGARFSANLSQLPTHVEKMAFAVSIDGAGTMGQMTSLVAEVSQNGKKALSLNLAGREFQEEKSIIVVEFYRKGTWRFKVTASGYNDGLSSLLKDYGGEEIWGTEPIWIPKGEKNSLNDEDAEAMYLKGKSYELNENYEEAMRYYRESAKLGNAEGMFLVGNMYYNGKGVARDYVEAMKWFQKADDIGNANSTYMIAWFYQNGNGVTQDYVESMKWFRKAADAGCSNAMYQIGCFYQNGYGVTQDYDEAMRWYSKAGNLGNEEAKRKISIIGKILQSPKEEAKNKVSSRENILQSPKEREEKYSNILKSYQKAAENGSIEAMRSLAWVYRNKEDYQSALKWFKMAVDAGSSEDYENVATVQHLLDRNNGKNKALSQSEAGMLLALAPVSNKKNRKENKKEKSCFITTAVCDSFNKPDDCYELTMFRNFRDTWLSGQEDGAQLISEYYHIAPSIVRNINLRADARKIYQEIWSQYLHPCLRYIELGDNMRCKELYISMVNHLKEIFLLKIQKQQKFDNVVRFL